MRVGLRQLSGMLVMVFSLSSLSVSLVSLQADSVDQSLGLQTLLIPHCVAQSSSSQSVHRSFCIDWLLVTFACSLSNDSVIACSSVFTAL